MESNDEVDLLASSNICGQTILRIVSRGNAIITELLRLAHNIPPSFAAPSKELARRGLEPIVCDFAYFRQAEAREKTIESSERLLELDHSFRDQHVAIVRRFYKLFESIYLYLKDFLQFLKDLSDGVFIAQTLSNVLLNADGKQLVAEALYLFGVMLILLEDRINGLVRERIVVAYLRYCGVAETDEFDRVRLLTARTTWLPSDSDPLASPYASSKKRPKDYPESYFARFPVPEHVVDMVIGRLRSDDVYHQIKAYPLPAHRSTALSTQAGMLYVILYFAPHVLRDERATMREIVDRHFPDNWVIAYHMGHFVDLSVAWAPYKAAAAALANTIAVDNVRALARKYWTAVPQCLQTTRHFLTEGVLVDEYVLDNIAPLLDAVRNCNVTLRWLLLQRHSVGAKLREIAEGDAGGAQGDEALFALLLDGAQLEYTLKRRLEQLLDARLARWASLRDEAATRMNELSAYFAGERALTRVRKSESLQTWFADLEAQIRALESDDSTLAGRKIQQLISALEEVEQFEQIEASLQVLQFLRETRDYLHQMVRVVNVKEDVLVALGIVSDMSYAWRLVHDFVPMMQRRVQRDPGSVIKLRAVFLKMSAAILAPLMRINQAGSDDLYSVSEFHSGELVKFVRLVLEIVPRSLFSIMKRIIGLITSHIRELPAKIDRSDLAQVAQLDRRYDLAEATHAISVFTEGILAMETTLVGVIKVDPKQLLEDGIRKELVRQIADALDRAIDFDSARPPAPVEFRRRLATLAELLDGFRRSFQYIQDYVSLQGLRIWQQEFSRIVNFNVELECNTFLKLQIYGWQSAFQSVAIPIPEYAPRDARSVNFVGRLARTLLAQTAPHNTIYLELMSAWHDRGGAEVVGIRTFSDLLTAIGVFGVAGLDRLFCFMLVKHTQALLGAMRALRGGARGFLAAVAQRLDPLDAVPQGAAALYGDALARAERALMDIRDEACAIGQMQLLRRQLQHLLRFRCKLDSGNLYNALDVANRAIMAEVQKNPAAYSGALLGELTDYLEVAGLSDAFSKIYVTAPPMPHAAVVALLLVLSQLSSEKRFQYDAKLGILFSRKKSGDWAFDETPFVVGIITLLKQLHSTHTQLFLGYLGQFVRAKINATLELNAVAPYPPDAVNTLHFIEHFLKLTDTPRKVIEQYIPPYIFDSFREQHENL
jgi:WASH complex subunit strumpellin